MILFSKTNTKVKPLYAVANQISDYSWGTNDKKGELPGFRNALFVLFLKVGAD